MKIINDAPKNPAGEGVGPWILVWSEWDHGTYQARWECHGEACGWALLLDAKGLCPSSTRNIAEIVRAITHWMPLPEPPK